MHGIVRPRFALAFLLALAACTDPRFSTVAAPSRQEALVPDATRPVMGWNSFDVLSTNRAGYGQTWLTEGHIKDASDAMRQKLQFAGYTYINIDSGWSANLSWTSNTIDQWGVPQADAQRFPSGIKGIADYVHAQGQKLGIYSVVGLPGEIYNGNYPIAGTSCHVQDIVKQPMTLVPNGWYAQWEIDWSNPCAQAYYDSMANEFASWGVDLVKVDGTTADNAGDIIAWQNAVAKTSRPMWFTVSAWPVPLALGPQIRNAGQGVRIDTDIDCYCSTISSWTASVNQRWNDLPNWLPFVGPGHFPDLDSMPISNNTGQAVQDGLNDVERQSVMTFWSMASSPLWVGGDIYFMDPQAQAILTNPEVIAVDQAGVMPVQVAGGNSQVWKKALPDGSIAVAVYNLGDSSTSITVGFGDVGVDGDASVRDLPSRTELGVFTGTWTASNVPAHGSRLVKLTPEASNGIAGYTWCSSEYQDCAAGNNVDVAYGALGHFVVKSGLSGNVSCMLATFGEDPAYGTVKGCYVRPHAGGGPPSFTYCAGEGQTCAASGIVDVAYGGVGSFTYKLAQQGSFGCNVGAFGDPAYGWPKACYTRPASGGVAYEAEAAQLQGAAVVAGCPGCAGGKKVGYLGGGAGNRLTFPQVDVATAGNHLVTIHAASADPRTFYVSVNGGAAVPVSLQSGDWSTPTTATLLLGLRAGSNTITFANDGQWAPDLDNIVVDAAAAAATPAESAYFVAPDGQGSIWAPRSRCSSPASTTPRRSNMA
jgi:hypothetical protein